MKEIAIMYGKIIIFIVAPMLAAITIIAHFISMFQSELVQLIVSVVGAFILGFPLIKYMHWIDDKIGF